MRTLAALLAVALAAPAAAHDHRDREGSLCTIHAGPRDRVAQDGDLVVPEGARVENAVALHGDVVIRRGAVVQKAVAAGGSVTVESGARVEEDVVAVGGGVRVMPDGEVGGDAVGLGGSVEVEKGGRIRGDIVTLGLRLAGFDLAREILDAIGAEGRCSVLRDEG